MSKADDKISVVIPVYRSEDSLPILVPELVDVLGNLNRDFEIVLVDDCSPDNSWAVMKDLKGKYDKHLKIVHLLKNSGQHNAILCGFSLVTGDIVVTMDDDLQNPPSEVPKLIAAIDRGFDLAIASYDSKKHSGIRNAAGGMIDILQRRMFGLPKDFQLTSFRAIRRVVVDNVVKMGGVFPYITSMLLSHTALYTNVEVDHRPRHFGQSRYTIKRSFLLAANMIFSYSSYPVYLVAAACAAAFAFALILAGYVSYRALVMGISVPGWASLVVVTSFFNAITLLCLLIFSLYLSRLNQQLTGTKVGYTVSEIYE
ncbi:MAG: glycosyltransferase family 2 protein [Armatimonadetes bacterium]|nr:glycosyltransferase family 2 protein [Armatimonadota bacterium]